MIKIRVKVYMTLDIDPEEYAIPSDGNVTEEFEEAVHEYFHDISGTKILNLKVIQENKYDG